MSTPSGPVDAERRDPPAAAPGSLRPGSGAGPVVAFIGAASLLAVATRGAPLPEFWDGGSAGFFRLLFEVLPFLVLGFVGLAVYAATGRRAGPRRGGSGGSGGAESFEDRMRAGFPLAVICTATLILAVLSAGGMQPLEERGMELGRMEAPGEGVFRTPWGMSRWFDLGVLAGEPPADPDDAAEGAGSTRGVGISLRTGLLLLLGMLGTAALWYRYGRKEEEAGEERRQPLDRERAAVQGAVHAGIEGMLVDPDPNTAIRGAYAHLLLALDDVGQGRWEHEGPTEHLHRVLGALRLRPAPLRELITLFELARFSHLHLTPVHRDRALEALRSVAAGLEVGR